MSKKKNKHAKPDDQLKPKLIKEDPKLDSRYLIPILIITFISFFPILNNGFINFDDPQYLTENPVVQNLNTENFKRFFTQPFVGNYQPIVMLCYSIQFKFAGLSAGGYHFFSLLMHLLNTMLVFFLAKRLLKNLIAAAVTALLFGIHPLHVESVAWLASQKDVIYTFFFLSSAIYYLKYVQEDQNRKYFIFSMLLFILSLLSKAQSVVLPAVFLLFDHLMQRKITMKVILEKIPHLALSIIFGALAVHYQKMAGAFQDFSYFKPHERVLFASYGFMEYLIQTVIPAKLAIFYPYPETDGKINTNMVYVGLGLVVVLAAIIFYFRKRSPVLVFGSLFFCVTIALVIQLIPVGDAIHADRYSYISLIGFFIIAGYYFSKLYENKNRRTWLIGAGAICFLTLAVLTFKQAGVFKDNITVYSRSLENYPAAIIYSNRGAEYFKDEKFQEALSDFKNAQILKIRFPNIWFNSAFTYQKLGMHKEAIADYTEALKYTNEKDKLMNIYTQRASAYKMQNDFASGINDLNKALELEPRLVNAYFDRAEMYGRTGKPQEALADLEKAIQMKPDFAPAYSNRGNVYAMIGNMNEALNDYNKALQLNANDGTTLFNRSQALNSMGRFAEALKDADAAKQLKYPVDEKYLAGLHLKVGK